MLATTAACLCASQLRLCGGGLLTTSGRGNGGKQRLPPAIVTVPRSLHLGWVTAATLVNVNAWVGRVHSLSASAASASAAAASFSSSSSSSSSFDALDYSWLFTCADDSDVLAVALLSVALAAAASFAYSLVCGLPAAGGAVSWALLALANGAPVGRAAEHIGPAARAALAKTEAALAAATFAAALAVGVFGGSSVGKKSDDGGHEQQQEEMDGMQSRAKTPVRQESSGGGYIYKKTSQTAIR